MILVYQNLALISVGINTPITIDETTMTQSRFENLNTV